MSAGMTVAYGLALLLHAAFFGMALHLLVAPRHGRLSGRAFVEVAQAVNPHWIMRVRVLSLARLALTAAIVGLLFDRRGDSPFWLALGALLAAAAGTAVDFMRGASLSRRVASWSPADPPADWELVRDRWLRLQSIRGAASAVGFVLLLSAALVDRPAGPPEGFAGSSPETATGKEAPRHCEATVYLPLADNDGQPFPEADWQEAMEGLVVPFGGATLGQPQEGCWLDARRRVHCEPIRPVVVSFTPERLDEFRAAVHQVGKRLRQEAVYVRFEEPRIELIPVGAGPGGQ